MVVNFYVRNFKSIKDSLLLNLTAAKRLKLINTVHVEKYGINSLPVAAIYGANGSGKSNLVIAIEFMKNKVVQGNKLHAIPFKFESETENSTSDFSILFIDRNNMMYHYGFSLKGNVIIEEWLSCYFTRRESSLFERVRNDNGAYEYHFSEKFIKSTNGGKNYLDYITKDLLPENTLLGETGKRESNSYCLDVLSWFKYDLIIIGAGYYSTGTPSKLILDPEFRNKATELLKDMDFDLSDITVRSRNVDKQYLLDNTANSQEEKQEVENTLESGKYYAWASVKHRFRIFTKNQGGNLMEQELIIRHKKDDGSYAFLSIDETSSGFKRMLDFIPVLTDSAEFKTFVIDEIERSLHTLISKRLISVFLSNSLKNQKNNQLIFVTHDTNLLDLSLLRRDEILFMEKDRDTSSSYLTNYAEFKIIEGLNTEKGYLDGRFGAIPIMNHNLR